MSAQVNEGIFQIHWCIHGGVIMPLSLTNAAPYGVAADVVEKSLKSLVEDKLVLSELLNYER